MRILTRLLAGLFVLLLSSRAFSQTTYLFDWGNSLSPAWADGNTSGTATNVGGSGINVAVNMAITGTGAFVATYPSVNVNNGNAASFQVQNSTDAIRVQQDLANLTSSNVITITFSGPVRNVAFGISDIDKNSTAAPFTYLDQVTITGTSPSGVAVPAVTKFLYNSPYVTVNGNVATASTNGTATNVTSLVQGSPAQDATVFVNFGSNIVTSITITYGNPNIASVQADPAAQAMAIGNLSFQRINRAPVSDNVTSQSLPQGYAATAIPALSSADRDGTIANYTITSVPTAAQGTLSTTCPPTPTGGTCTGGFVNLTPAVLTANANAISLTPAQAAALRFDPTGNFSGNATFTYTATDNYGLVSNAANYTIPVIQQPPTAVNIMTGSMANTLAATAIPTLNASDPDGTIATYQITTLPTPAQGVISVPCPPNFTGGTCTGGFTNLDATVLGNYPSGIPLTPAQAAGMRFDPTAAFVGNATFNYNAVDNNGLTSNTANYTIPVTASATTARPPLSNNVTSQALNNSLAATTIPGLQSIDLDGTIASYTVLTVPSAASGTLSTTCPPTPAGATCTVGFMNLDAAVLAANPAGITLNAAQAAALRFDPAATFTGTASFTYRATDNNSLLSNTATYNIPVVNTPPVSSNLQAVLTFNAPASVIPALSAADNDGTIASYTITSVPTLAQGVLSVSCPPNFTGATCTAGFQDLTPTVLSSNGGTLVLTPAQAASIRFDPAATFAGTATFNYFATDNNGNTSAASTYSLAVGVQPPVANDVTASVLPNTNAATAITALNATDADGTIASYNILTLPLTTEGVLSVPCPPNFTGGTCTAGFTNLDATVLGNYPSGIPLTPTQAAGLRFDPAAGFTGVGSFTYNATDNNGFLSNTAIYTLPISGSGNIPPIARDVYATTMSNTLAATSVPGLSGVDVDGTIFGYVLTSVPPSTNGVLSVPCPPNITGAGTCTGGFQDITATTLTSNSGAILLTTTQAAGLRFDPAPNFVGTVSFSYYVVDNSAATSSDAEYYIPVTSTPPVANAVTSASMSNTAAATTISSFSASDPDGTVATYYIESVAPTAQGVMSISCPPNLIGATCTGGFQDLTAAVLANYPTTGIPVTPAQIATMRFDPAAGYVGNVVINYHVVDNSGQMSNSATYTIPVTGVNPISNSVTSPKMNNSNGPTAITPLSSTDPDGTITSYVISSIPPASQGVLSTTCPPTPTGGTCTGGFVNLDATVLSSNPGGIVLTAAQAGALRLDPAAGFSGNAAFNYYAFDNSGNISNVATYVIPVGSVLTLPLTLVNFSAERSGDNIIARWKTEDEVNVGHFEVEYSTDGSHYSNGASVNANNQSVNEYQSTLVSYTQPLYYLRLKSVDIDGKVKYSGVVTVTYGKSGKGVIVTPNPAGPNMQFIITSDVKAMADVRVISSTGQVIYRTRQQVFKGTNVMPGNQVLPKLTSGTYMLNVIIDGQILTSTFVY